MPCPICISLLTYLNRTGSDTLFSFQMKQLDGLSYFAFKSKCPVLYEKVILSWYIFFFGKGSQPTSFCMFSVYISSDTTVISVIRQVTWKQYSAQCTITFRPHFCSDTILNSPNQPIMPCPKPPSSLRLISCYPSALSTRKLPLPTGPKHLSTSKAITFIYV